PSPPGNGSTISPGAAAMGSRLPLVLAFLLVVGAARPPDGGVAGAEKKPDAGPAKAAPKFTFQGHLAPFVENYCLPCHPGPKPKGGLNLDKLIGDETSLKKQRLTWETVLKVVRSGDMPPSNRKQPKPPERQAVAGFLEAEVAKVDCTQKDPGRVTV